MLKRVRIRENERAFLFRHGCFDQVLMPGRHLFLALPGTLEVERHDVGTAEATGGSIATLMKSHRTELAAHLTEVAAAEGEVALVAVDGIPHAVVQPGQRRYYWSEFATISVERFPLEGSAAVPAERLTTSFLSAAAQAIALARVTEREVVIHVLNGTRLGRLAPGVHAFWVTQGEHRFERFDTRQLPLEISGQDILTKDRVGVRLSVIGYYRITDPERLMDTVGGASDYLYRHGQLALRAVVGAMTLDEILAATTGIDAAMVEAVATKAEEIGVTLETLTVRDVILPGEIREMMNRVLVAEREAQANLIRRREETAATRALLNTARLMDDNPTLLRLKELEALERVSGQIGSLQVLGGLDGVLDQLIRIRKDG